MLMSNFTGKTRIYRKDFSNGTSYSTQLGKRRQDGQYDNIFINVQFKRDIALKHKTDIEVRNGWLSFYINREDKPVFYIFISDFEVVDIVDDREFEQVSYDDQDLPF